METIHSSETSVLRKAARRIILENGILRSLNLIEVIFRNFEVRELKKAIKSCVGINSLLVKYTEAIRDLYR
jgi:hypothetical protein